MSKFNKTSVRSATGTGPIVTATTPTGTTHEGAPGYARDPKSELFLLAVSNMVGEHTFYERAGDRDQRYEQLIAHVAVADPDWTGRFLAWLRGDGNMRSASLVGALEAAKAMLGAKIPGARQIVASVLQRADEPGEALAYWTSRYGRAIPMPVKNGVADAVRRLYDERALLKYDTVSKGYRFADVLDLCHPAPQQTSKTIAEIATERGVPVDEVVGHFIREAIEAAPDAWSHFDVADFVRKPLPTLSADFRAKPFSRALNMTAEDLIAALRPVPVTWQNDLFACALARRHNRDESCRDTLPMLRANAALRQAAADDPTVMLYPNALAAAGMTWEDALSLVGSKVDKAKLWAALIPSMGYMALLRNLRNFDEAGVPDGVAHDVMARLTNPDRVARSRQFPFRFLSAYKALGSLRWGHTLEVALNLSLNNVPELPGRTLVLVDRSGSMFGTISGKSGLDRADQAALFGAALALRNVGRVDLVQFGTTSAPVPVAAGDSLLRVVRERFTDLGGTNTASAVARWYAGHDRVLIVTDEQSRDGDPGGNVPITVPVYTWNLAGYQFGHGAGGTNRHVFAGMTDAAFRLVPLLEAGKSQTWPF